MSKEQNRDEAKNVEEALLIAAKRMKFMSGIDEFERIKIVSLANFVAAEAVKVPLELP